MTSEVTIRLDIEKISKLTGDGRESDIVIAHDLPWRLRASTEPSDGVKHLAVHLSCNWESERSKYWKVEFTANFTAHVEGDERKEMKMTSFFENGGPTSKGLSKFLACNEPVNEEKKTEPSWISQIWRYWKPQEQITDESRSHEGKISIECRVLVEKSIGIGKRVILDFAQPVNGIKSNVVLKIGDRKLNVSKDILGIHSPVFASMFFGKFEEEQKDEIVLQDIVYENFVDLLNLVYPTTFEITARNVHQILELADRFQVESVLARITAYFIETKKFETVVKLKIAEQYRLKRLKDFCIRSFSTIEQIKAVKETPEYKSFSDAIRAAICEKVLEC